MHACTRRAIGNLNCITYTYVRTYVCAHDTAHGLNFGHVNARMYACMHVCTYDDDNSSVIPIIGVMIESSALHHLPSTLISTMIVTYMFTPAKIVGGQ